MPRLLIRIAGTATILTAIVAPVTAGDLRVSGKLISENLSGPPIQVASGDKVFNLNADMIDGMNAADFAAVSDLKTPGSGAEVHWKNLIGIPIKSIDQECAEFDGCFTGDTPGFPVTITEPGSYRLGSNLDIRHLPTPEGIDVIKIQSSNVDLNLSGFAIIGIVTCTGTPVTGCSPNGSTGDGVEIAKIALDSITIRNGSIRGMGSRGIVCDSRCMVDGISVSENLNDGIKVSRGSVIRNSYAFRNRGDGLQGAGTIINSRVEGNGLSGLYLDGTAVAFHNTATNNANSGITDTRDGARPPPTAHLRVSDNSISENGMAGISLLANGGLITTNTISANGGDGITCGGGCLIQNNLISENGGYGLRTVSGNGGNGFNMFEANASGSVINTGSGMVLSQGGNVCITNSTC